MKKLIAIIGFVTILSANSILFAQEEARSPLYDYSELQLNSTDTIPGFEDQDNKLKITGTIFYNDGVTPAKDVIIYIYQPNAEGSFETQKNNDKKYITHRAWVKTDADGKYTFYTFIPGAPYVPLTFPRTRGMKQILPVIKEPGKPEYDFDAFIFDDDPAISSRCRKKLDRIGYKGMLSLVKKEDMYVATKDIVISQSNPSHIAVAAL
ncbi:peptidase associated/transthyretin-like domain-containing protein [Aestuariivivens insulae]|uniref:hypothetical protein n=1 Tax=Aestuariivivens insulae TaxID=1621988 RepID=UPI001F565C77|nr:hypothetical protein [Aestuariivivens insulae]